MAKLKTPSSQELYKQKLERDKEAASSSFPPGLINHGNTCFMNSVLQGLIATRLLNDLVHFRPIPPHLQDDSSIFLAAQRSPQLTNSHDFGGDYRQPFTDAMPIGDVFISLMIRAWASQEKQKRETLTPKALLGAVGKKYDQYLDFAQQDAHEFLRILLDSMRMEEQDVIKKRIPPPPAPAPSEPDSLISFSDMIFGGRLTSILVCQKCKHISQTYEDFNDLSLSIKPEDFVRERKRDRFKNFTKRLKFSSTANSAASSTTRLAHISLPAADMHRSSSVPPTPKERQDNEMSNGLEDPPITTDERRRSIDILSPDPVPATAEKPLPSPPESIEIIETSPILDPPTSAGEESSSESRHVEFKDKVAPEMKDKSRDRWNKLSRRISASMGLSSKSSARRSRDRTSKDLQNPQTPPPLPTHIPLPATPNPEAGLPQIILSRPNSPSDVPTPPDRSARRHSVSPAAGAVSPKGLRSSSKKSKHRSLSPSTSKRLPKFELQNPQVAELEYLRRVLADVTTPSSTNPFPNLFRSSTSPGEQLAKFSSTAGTTLPGVEDCLRMFTAVEILTGENKVGCRRCWKIEHGLYPGKGKKAAEGEKVNATQHGSDSDDEEAKSSPKADPVEEGLPIAQPVPLSSSAASAASTASILSEGEETSFSTVESSANSSSSAEGVVVPSSRTSYEQPYTPSTARPTDPNFPPHPLPRVPLERDFTVRASTAVPIHLNGVPGSLGVPPRNHRRPRTASDAGSVSTTTSTIDTTTTDGEDEREESDLSASVYSDTNTSAVSDSAASPPKPKPKSSKPSKKPKPVVMSPAYKRYLIDIPPPVLVIHLKRFQQLAQSSARSRKIDDFVAFPETLDLKPFLAPRKQDFGMELKKKEAKMLQRMESETCLYRLYAVVVHTGNMLGGHYVAYVALPSPPPATRREETSPATPSEEEPADAFQSPTTPTSPRPPSARQWAYVSDTVVRSATLDEVLKAKAYICFYERI